MENLPELKRYYNGINYRYNAKRIIEKLCGLCGYPISMKTEKCLNPDCQASYKKDRMGVIYAPEELLDELDAENNVRYNPEFSREKALSDEELLLKFQHEDYKEF